jgi:hypothetical protein
MKRLIEVAYDPCIPSIEEDGTLSARQVLPNSKEIIHELGESSKRAYVDAWRDFKWFPASVRN